MGFATAMNLNSEDSGERTHERRTRRDGLTDSYAWDMEEHALRGCLFLTAWIRSEQDQLCIASYQLPLSISTYQDILLGELPLTCLS